jgi:hypothetical protein
MSHLLGHVNWHILVTSYPQDWNHIIEYQATIFFISVPYALQMIVLQHNMTLTPKQNQPVAKLYVKLKVIKAWLLLSSSCNKSLKTIGKKTTLRNLYQFFLLLSIKLPLGLSPVILLLFCGISVAEFLNNT